MSSVHLSLVDPESSTSWISSLALPDCPAPYEARQQLENTIALATETAVTHVLPASCNGVDIALRALGVGRGSEVITVAVNSSAVIDSCARIGATVRFADVELGDGVLAADHCVKLLSPKTVAVVVPLMFGIPGRLEELLDVASSYGVGIVVLAGSAAGARVVGKGLGAFADIVCLQFDASTDPYVPQPVTAIGSSSGDLMDGIDRLTTESVDEADAALHHLLTVQLERRLTHERRIHELAAVYRSRLGIFPNVVLPKDSSAIFSRYPLRYQERSTLQFELLGREIESVVDVHLSAPSQILERVPNTANWIETELSIPCHAGMTEADAHAICDVIVGVINVSV